MGQEGNGDEMNSEKVRILKDGKEYEAVLREIGGRLGAFFVPDTDLDKPICVREDQNSNHSDGRFHHIQIFWVTDNYIYGAWRPTFWDGWTSLRGGVDADGWVAHRWQRNGLYSMRSRHMNRMDLVNCQPNEDTLIRPYGGYSKPNKPSRRHALSKKEIKTDEIPKEGIYEIVGRKVTKKK